MSLIKKLIITILGTFVVFSVISLFKSSQWELSRTISIKAEKSKIYPYLNEIRNWQKWSPWDVTTDRTLIFNFEGPDKGTGATIRWNGKDTNAGKRILISSDPDTGVTYQMLLGKGSFKVDGEVRIEDSKDGFTIVTWTDRKDLGWNIMQRLFSSTADDVIGQQFDKGLGRLKKLVESR